jgi:Sec-independent protein translocase protein TatA
MFRTIGATEILIIVGGTKIPSLMRGLGQGLREFRREMRGDSDKDVKSEPSMKDKP